MTCRSSEKHRFVKVVSLTFLPKIAFFGESLYLPDYRVVDPWIHTSPLVLNYLQIRLGLCRHIGLCIMGTRMLVRRDIRRVIVMETCLALAESSNPLLRRGPVMMLA